MPFLISSRGQRLGAPLGERQAHRVFNALRDSLGWVNRGAHAAPRLHDLRHTFAVRRLVLWHAEGADVNQKILALSTYLGHAEIFYTYWYLTAVPELMASPAASSNASSICRETVMSKPTSSPRHLPHSSKLTSPST
jgi:integrase